MNVRTVPIPEPKKRPRAASRRHAAGPRSATVRGIPSRHRRRPQGGPSPEPELEARRTVMAWVAARLATLERITAEEVTRSTACALRHALTDDPRLLAAFGSSGVSNRSRPRRSRVSACR